MRPDNFKSQAGRRGQLSPRWQRAMRAWYESAKWIHPPTWRAPNLSEWFSKGLSKGATSAAFAQPTKRMWRRWLCGVWVGAALAVAWPAGISAVDAEHGATWGIDAQMISAAITPGVARHRLPREISLPQVGLDGDFSVRYTIDAALQGEADRLLKKYHPDYGALAVLDADSGRVLAMASSARDGSEPGNMTMRNSYPAASVFKIVTAVAAVNENKLAAQSVLPFNGKSTSLYKKNVFEHRDNQWTRRYSFRESFAYSVNSIFGRVGSVVLGGDAMLDYAQRLGFNRRFHSDFGFDAGMVEVDTADAWQVAEMASGYTRRNTLSPLHGAALAATAINGGHLVAPALVESIIGPNGVPLYHYAQPPKRPVMSRQTALELQHMMRATVAFGSSRKAFANFHRRALKEVVVGGKTGSLSGRIPPGKYDWFVGFAQLDGRKIAYAVLCINKKKWYVKSTQLAREMLEFYFSELQKTVAAS